SARVLVVEEHRDSREILEEMLVWWRLRAEGAPASEAAWTALERAWTEKDPFRVVIISTSAPDSDGSALAEKIGKDERFTRVWLVLLETAGHAAQAARHAGLCSAAHLIKPAKYSQLSAAILRALGLNGPALHPVVPAAATAVTGSARNFPSSLPIDVLLAEDHPVNQIFARQLLERRGYRVTLANNGREAVAGLASQRFDLVLMDIQMPEVGGGDAVAAIREHEKTTGQHIPIGAMTAHAMRGDRERCLAAGMDGYIAKPINSTELFGLIESLLPVSTAMAVTAAPHPAAASSRNGSAVLDPRVLLERVEGNRALLRQIVDVFCADCPKTLSRIQKAVANRDSKELAFAAHTLKGSLVTL